MSQIAYTLLAYAVGLVALWGYAVGLWMEGRTLDRRQRGATATGRQGTSGA